MLLCTHSLNSHFNPPVWNENNVRVIEYCIINNPWKSSYHLTISKHIDVTIIYETSCVLYTAITRTSEIEVKFNSFRWINSLCKIIFFSNCCLALYQLSSAAVCPLQQSESFLIDKRNSNNLIIIRKTNEDHSVFVIFYLFHTNHTSTSICNSPNCSRVMETMLLEFLLCMCS